jgi:hypothetical protein
MYEEEQQGLLQLRNEGKQEHLQHLHRTYETEQQHLQLTCEGESSSTFPSKNREVESFM